MTLLWTTEQIEKARGDFRVFVYMVWLAISLPPPTPIQYDMADKLQKPPSDRFIIQGFRGVAKSFLTCAFVVWRLWKDNQLKCMIISASKDRADANAVFIKRIIQTLPFLSVMLPTPGQRDTQNLFDVGGCVPDISPSVKSVGITGQITGSRADILVADDVEVPNNSGTQPQRDKLGEAVKEFDAILKPGGQIIYLGTPQNEMSLYNELQKRGYESIIWPVLYPESQEEREFYGERLASVIAVPYDSNPAKYKGLPTDPARFNEEEILKRRLSYGRAGFALQFMLNTNLSDAAKYPLKASDLIVTDLDINETSLKWAWASGGSQRLTTIPCVGLKGDYFYSSLSRSPETSEYTGTVMAIDPSGRGKDETAYAILKFLNGYLFLMEVGGYQEGYTDVTLRALATKAKYYGVNDVIIEANYGDGMFTKLITPIFNELHPCAINEVKHSKQKELRIIDTLEPILARHKLIVDQNVILDDYKVYERDITRSLVYQLTRISRDKGSLAHDDRLDAVTMGVAFWLEVLDRDAQVGIDEALDGALDKWLDPDRGIFYTEETVRPGASRQSVSGLNILDGYL